MAQRKRDMEEGETERLLSGEEAPDAESDNAEKMIGSAGVCAAVLVIPAASATSAVTRPVVVPVPLSECSKSEFAPLLDGQNSTRSSDSGSKNSEASSNKDERSLCRICLVSSKFGSAGIW